MVRITGLSAAVKETRAALKELNRANRLKKKSDQLDALGKAVPNLKSAHSRLKHLA